MPQDVMLPINKQGVNLAADRLLQVSIEDQYRPSNSRVYHSVDISQCIK